MSGPKGKRNKARRRDVSCVFFAPFDVNSVDIVVRAPVMHSIKVSRKEVATAGRPAAARFFSKRVRPHCAHLNLTRKFISESREGGGAEVTV